MCVLKAAMSSTCLTRVDTQNIIIPDTEPLVCEGCGRSEYDMDSGYYVIENVCTECLLDDESIYSD